MSEPSRSTAVDSLPGRVAGLGLLIAIALSLGIALHPLAVDDAFVTYRHARNLATGAGFAYNTESPVLSTTAPLYALLLAAGAWLGFDLPALANAWSAGALGAGAALIWLLGHRERTPWVGSLAALLYVLWPLLWLSLGLETASFLALGLGALAAYRSGRLYLAAALLAAATLMRADALVLTLVLAVDVALRLLSGCRWADWQSARQRLSPRVAVGAAAVYAAVMLPVVGWLTWQFGSPLPATLAAKRAQAELGVTGFYAHTTYLQGLGVLARARLAQSPFYLLLIPAVALGLPAAGRRAGWVRLVIAWGVAHLASYTILGVTPYYWYYAPLVPGLVCTAALGIVESACWLGRGGASRAVKWGVGGLWVAGLLAALLCSDWAMVQALSGPVPPPENPVSKVLPEAKVDTYEQAGRWLYEHTPPDVLVGVTEVGIMGYYARRPMVDFLGLLAPDVAEALARGDLYWALLHYQPDYLALTAVSPLYAYDLRADPWFQAAYAPVQTFDDARFWGSPLTVYERRIERSPLVDPSAGRLPEGAILLDADFDPIRLLGAVTADDTAQPGAVLALTLYWEALGPVDRDYVVFVHLLGQYDRVIAQRDATPGLGARPTSQWTPGQVVADPYLLALPEAAYAPDEAVWEVGLYDPGTGQRLQLTAGGDNLRFGAVSIEPVVGPLHLSFGPAVLTGYSLDRLAMGPGETLSVRLYWEGEGPAGVTVRLVAETGGVAAQASGDLSQDLHVLTLGTGTPPGVYELQVLLADPATGQAWPLLGTDGQPRGDSARLTKVRLYPG